MGKRKPATRRCGICGLPGHDRRSHRPARRAVRRNLDAYVDEQGRVRPIRGSTGYVDQPAGGSASRATKPTASAAARVEPWQLGRQEYLRSKRLTFDTAKKYDGRAQAAGSASHEALVRAAHRQGKPVPAAVLTEYGLSTLGAGRPATTKAPSRMETLMQEAEAARNRQAVEATRQRVALQIAKLDAKAQAKKKRQPSRNPSGASGSRRSHR